MKLFCQWRLETLRIIAEKFSVSGWWKEINKFKKTDIEDCYFQHDGATCHTKRQNREQLLSQLSTNLI